jgi:hypothetical protein
MSPWSFGSIHHNSSKTWGLPRHFEASAEQSQGSPRAVQYSAVQYCTYNTSMACSGKILENPIWLIHWLLSNTSLEDGAQTSELRAETSQYAFAQHVFDMISFIAPPHVPYSTSSHAATYLYLYKRECLRAPATKEASDLLACHHPTILVHYLRHCSVLLIKTVWEVH